ncbi:MAG: hypothetical protein O6945_15425 [Gammaproteobacteria bacterium]|nr:hypothetical protein [Gammaproteobacteria bacterium]
MKLAVVVLTLTSVLPGPATAQASAAPEPTELEVWALQQGSRVIWSEEVGRIESTDAQAVITAVVVEKSQNIPGRVRGVRVDLKNETSTDQIYVEEKELVYLKRDLTRMDCSIARMRNESGATYRVQGIERCRPSQPIPQAYCPGYYIGPEFEGLSLSTFAGHNYRFPSKRPSVMADAIGRAMSEFGIEDKIPTPERIQLPVEDLDKIVTSAVHHFPSLASSRGIKAAGYSLRDDQRFAWAVFWPYKRINDFAYSRSVYCELVGPDGVWNCNRNKERGYLSLPGQDKEVVITGKLSRDSAVALIEFARPKLRYKVKDTDMDLWHVSSISPPDQSSEKFFISFRDSASGWISFQIKEAGLDADERFEIVQRWDDDRSPCG